MSSLKMAMGVSLLASVPALATPYEWNGADGTTTLGDVMVEKSGGVASLTGSNASWTYSDPSSFDSLTGVDLISATTLSSLTVADGVDFKARAGTLDQGEGALPATIAVNHARATFVASVEKPIVSTSTISGNAGVVAFTGDGTGGIEMGDSTYTLEGQIKKDWSMVVANTRLSDLVAVTGMFRSTYSGKGYFFENDGETASVQVQCLAGTTMLCAVYDFKQDGADIRVRLRVSATSYDTRYNPGYEEPGSYKVIMTEDGGAGTKFWPISSEGASWQTYWYASDLTLELKSKPGSYVPTPSVTVSAANELTKATGARIEFGDVQGSPVEVTVGNKGAFLGAGCVVVHSNAFVTLAVNGDNQSGYGLSGEAWYVLGSCARMVSKGYFTIGGWQGVELGSDAEWKQLSSSGTYLSKLKYHGAKTIGNINLGQGSNPEITVDGQGKASVHEGVLKAYTYTSLTTTLNVADATGTPDADYVITGGIAELATGSNNDMKFKKTGAGTLRIEGPFTAVRYPFQLTAGTMELGANGVSSAAQDWITKGASTLACAASTTNTIGNLSLEANLTIDMKENAELSITSVSEWAGQYPTVRLNVVAAEGARVRIGQSAADLPASVRVRMRLNGEKCRTDENGYLEYKPKTGLMLLFR